MPGGCCAFSTLSGGWLQALGAWTLSIPEFEVKLETGRHIFYHADAARLLRERLTEQEMRPKDDRPFRDAEIDHFIEEMLSAADAPRNCWPACIRSLGKRWQTPIGITSMTPIRSPTLRRFAACGAS